MAIAVVAAGLQAQVAAARPTPPSPGAAGIGDRLFPTLGNGGYDVQHYDLDLRYATADARAVDRRHGDDRRARHAPRSRCRASTWTSAAAASPAVTVDGRRADATRDGEELVITPRRPIADGAFFVVRVEHFTATPTQPDPNDIATEAFFITPDGSATAAQSNVAHLIYPSNDHPRDKATFTIRFDVPAGETAVANGVLVDQRTRGGRTRWTYVQRQPMATELTQLAVGDYDVVDLGRHGGVPLRDVTPRRLGDSFRPQLDRVTTHIDMQDAVGRYPFDLYGSLLVDQPLGFALETQTLSLFDTTWFTDYPQGVWDPVMLHELSHMWFGDSVAPYEWSDLWQNEGHATWYELRYSRRCGARWPTRAAADADRRPHLSEPHGEARPAQRGVAHLHGRPVVAGLLGHEREPEP